MLTHLRLLPKPPPKPRKKIVEFRRKSSTFMCFNIEADCVSIRINHNGKVHLADLFEDNTLLTYCGITVKDADQQTDWIEEQEHGVNCKRCARYDR